MKITITHNDPVDALPYVPGRKYGIVKVDKVYPSDWSQDTIAGARALQDRPSGTAKGNTIPVFDSVWGYINEINNDPRAYPFWRSEGWLWINIPYKAERKTPRCECIVSPGNIISWDEQTYTHRKVLSYECTINTLSALDPDKDNWKYRPDLFWKATSYNRNWEINNVGNGIDAFTMRIRNPGTDLWIHKDEIEEFPAGNYQYRLLGTDVYDGEQPLMRIVGNQRVFYTGWKITSPSVIPPVGWNLC